MASSKVTLTPKIRKVLMMCASPIGLVKQNDSLKLLIARRSETKEDLEYSEVSVPDSALRVLIRKKLIFPKALRNEKTCVGTQYLLTDRGHEIVKAVTEQVKNALKRS